MHQRKLARRTLLLLAAVALLAFAGPQRAQALVINFDDITNANLGAVPTNYQGMTWAGDWIVLSDSAFQAYGNGYTAPSPAYAASNGSGMLVVTVADGANFDFVGAWFTGWGPAGPGMATSVTVQGYNNGLPVGPAVSMDLNDVGYEWMQADVMNIDELHFTSSGEDEWWLMDDLTLNAPTLVPEPGTVLLMGSGLLGLAYQGRKRSA
jgi:hypothetical protein